MIPGLSAAAIRPGFVACIEIGCPAVIWRPRKKRPRCSGCDKKIADREAWLAEVRDRTKRPVSQVA